MSLPNQKSAPTVVPAPAKSTYPTLEEAIALLEKNPKMDNPFDNPNPATLVEGTEPTPIKKKRLGNGNRFETAREKMENSSKKASGISGPYGRVHSVVDGLRAMLRKVGDSPFTAEELSDAAEKAFVNAYPLKKKSTSDSSGLYTGEGLLFYVLGGNLLFDPKAEVYRFTPAFKAYLSSPPVKG